MRFNTDPNFVGIPKLIEAHKEQIEKFETWASQDQWEEFHCNHFDWWTFPIDAPSRFHWMWTVYEGEVAELNKNPQFVQRYIRGIELVSASWGWDVGKRAYIPNPKPGQSWHHWCIRLCKATQSAKLFGQRDLFDSLKTYGRDLMKQGEPMLFRGKNFSYLFQNTE